MAMQAFLGEPSPNVKQWIIDRAKTVVKYTAASGLPDWEGIIVGELTKNSIPNKSNAEIVEIGSSVTSIGGDAFYACLNLINVTIPNSVMNIGERAFAYCRELTSVTIGNSVANIGNNAFAYCNESLFDTTTIPGVKLVDGWAVGRTGLLSGDLNLTGVRGIADNAFANLSGLTSVTIPDSVTSIGQYAFENCDELTNVTIGDGVTSIGQYAFEGCTNLMDVTFNNEKSVIQGMANYSWSLRAGCTIHCAGGEDIIIP